MSRKVDELAAEWYEEKRAKEQARAEAMCVLNDSMPTLRDKRRAPVVEVNRDGERFFRNFGKATT